MIALAGIPQVSAEQRSDTILIQGNPAGTQTVQTDKAGVTQSNIPTTIAAVAITSLPPGNSTLPECQPNTKAAAMIT